MSDKPLDAVGPPVTSGVGKHDFIKYDDKEHKVNNFRLDRGETVTLTFVATLKPDDENTIIN